MGLKLKSDIFEIVARNVSLADIVNKYAGTNLTEVKRTCKCPFCQQGEAGRSRSDLKFSIWQRGGVWSYKCFRPGCVANKTGDVTDFVQLYLEEIENTKLNKYETVARILTDDVNDGQPLLNEMTEADDPVARRDWWKKTKKAKAEALEKAAIRHALEEAKMYYRDRLLFGETEECEDARRWLADHGVDFDRFTSIGYAPDERRGLYTYLRSRGVNPEDMVAAAIIEPPHGTRNYNYNKFRGRITFAVSDKNGEPIGMTAMSMDPKLEGKSNQYMTATTRHRKETGAFVHLPTPLFDQKKALIGLDGALHATMTTGKAHLLSTPLEVMQARSAGIDNVVAPVVNMRPQKVDLAMFRRSYPGATIDRTTLEELKAARPDDVGHEERIEEIYKMLDDPGISPHKAKMLERELDRLEKSEDNKESHGAAMMARRAVAEEKQLKKGLAVKKTAAPSGQTMTIDLAAVTGQQEMPAEKKKEPKTPSSVAKSAKKTSDYLARAEKAWAAKRAGKATV